jgi:hypothetical protein
VVRTEDGVPLVQTLPKAQQRRLDELMARHDEGQLDDQELAALQALVAEADALARDNARRLVEHRRWLRMAIVSRASAAPG